MKLLAGAIAAAVALLLAWNRLSMSDRNFREQHRRSHDSCRRAEACRQPWNGYRPTIAARIGQWARGRLFGVLAAERDVADLWSKQSIECAAEAR